MAVGPHRSRVFSEGGTLVLPSKDGVVSRWLVHVEGDEWSGSVTPMGRSAADSSLEPIEVAWYNMNTGAIVPAGSAPTDDVCMLIDGTGLALVITVAVSVGSVKIVADPVVG